MKKREYPKTVLRKKVIKGAFWTGFFLVLFLSVVAIVRVGNVTTTQAEVQSVKPIEKTINHAAGEGSQSFAENFALHYFDWQNTNEAKIVRVERLQPFLATGLDEQAGLSFEEMRWNSKLSESQVWNVEETGEDTALITLRVQHMLTKIIPPDPKAVAKAKEKKEKAPKVEERTSGPFEKYFVIPIKTDGKSFVVHKIPYFTAAPEKPLLTSEALVDENGKLTDPLLQDEITAGLTTFFKIYTTGTQEELSYYVKGEEIHSMNGIITFKEVKNTVIKPGEAEDEYCVFATVVFQENLSKAQVVYPYELVLVKEENRWFVKTMKNQ